MLSLMTLPHSFTTPSYSNSDSALHSYNLATSSPAATSYNASQNFDLSITTTSSMFPSPIDKGNQPPSHFHERPSSPTSTPSPVSIPHDQSFAHYATSSPTPTYSHSYESPNHTMAYPQLHSTSPVGAGQVPPYGSNSNQSSEPSPIATSSSHPTLTSRHFLVPPSRLAESSDGHLSSPNRSQGAISDSEEVPPYNTGDYSSIGPHRNQYYGRPASTRTIEQYSRDKLRGAFEELRTALPESIGRTKRGRADLLAAAASYIRRVQQQSQHAEEVVNDQANTIHQLQSQLRNLQMQVQHQQQHHVAESYSSVRSTHTTEPIAYPTLYQPHPHHQ